ncbi:protein-disulfide reductase DsbD family protein [Pendulispora albinea]|uniref:Thioredoxin family protein n=1 Tax=Pendulispora albinea TaxID=2741071 RepID=A0ABZ2LTQ8_9BACT
MNQATLVTPRTTNKRLWMLLGVGFAGALLLALVGRSLWPLLQELSHDSNAYGKLAQQNPALAVAVSFGVGLVSSLTPCVFPMVPITVSIFGATDTQSRWRGAALSATFVLGIATLFVPLGIAAALTGSLMGAALANPWVVSGIAILFVALAASMFGAFEIALPSSLTNRLSSVGGVGFKGAFIVGLAMGLIAAPCTGPFVTGMLVSIAQTKDILVGGFSMFSFALGLGMLFFIAGTFAVNLPKAGAWMLGIKWGSGVVLAYMAFAYLRDSFGTVRGLVRPDTLYGIVGAVVLLIGLVLGSIHIAAERRKSPIAHLSKPMKLASIVPSVVGAFMFISWMQVFQNGLEREAAAREAIAANKDLASAPPISWQSGEEAARAQATTANKPVIVDFGATWCKACSELDESTWPDPRVRAAAASFVAIRVDATDDDDPEVQRLRKKYGVIGLPTVVVINGHGEEMKRFNEYVTPEKMAEAIKSVN